MSTDKVWRIREQLRLVTEEFEREMRERGFDPQQAENIPLTPSLARLQLEQTNLSARLDELTETGTTMTELERITDQLKRAFEGEAWHGPSVMEILADVTAQEATTRVFPGVHTIWELTLHIGAWEDACVRRLRGERAELSDVEDWGPATDTSESGWEQLKLTLQRGNRSLREAVAMIDERRLDEPIIPGMPSVYVTIQGVVQHDLYHAGQIAILKKALKEVRNE